MVSLLQRLVDATLQRFGTGGNTTTPTAYDASESNATAPFATLAINNSFTPSASLSAYYSPNGTASGLQNDTAIIDEFTCPVDVSVRYASAIGIDLAMPQWQAILIILGLGIIILITIVGNILVILSVFTYKPLRIVQNFFIVSLAVADLTVAILVLPLNVANNVLGRWMFGIHLCKMWLTSDVLCCTSSILNLCAIALDRYWAITDPINYAQKRTVERVLFLIAGVWLLSLGISSPPLIGWNDWPDEFDSEKHPCALNSNPGYRVYSALGSFFIPLIIMTTVYIEIYVATRRRLRERAKASRFNATNVRGGAGGAGVAGGTGRDGGGASAAAALTAAASQAGARDAAVAHQDQDSISSETNHNEHPALCDTAQAAHALKMRKKEKRQRAKDSLRLDGGGRGDAGGGGAAKRDDKLLVPVLMVREDSCTDIGAENSSDSVTKQQLTDSPALIEEHFQKTSTAAAAAATLSKLTRVTTVVKKPSTVYQFIEEKQKISLSKERRAARTLGIIMGVFIACWVPFFTVYIVLPFCPTCCPSDQLMELMTWLGYINSALNPIIYTIFNLDYRRAFQKLLGIKF